MISVFMKSETFVSPAVYENTVVEFQQYYRRHILSNNTSWTTQHQPIGNNVIKIVLLNLNSIIWCLIVWAFDSEHLCRSNDVRRLTFGVRGSMLFDAYPYSRRCHRRRPNSTNRAHTYTSGSAPGVPPRAPRHSRPSKGFFSKFWIAHKILAILANFTNWPCCATKRAKWQQCRI